MWQRNFFFCLLSFFLFPLVAQTETLYPVTEGELSRLEAISLLLEQQSTGQKQLVQSLQGQLTERSKQVVTLQELSTQLRLQMQASKTLSDSSQRQLTQAQESQAKSEASYSAYVDAAALTLSKQISDDAAVLEKQKGKTLKAEFWVGLLRNIAIVETIILLALGVLAYLKFRLKIL